MKAYLSQPTEFYTDLTLQTFVEQKIKEILKLMNIVIDGVENPAYYKLPPTDKIGIAKDAYYMMTVFLPKIDECEVFVYTCNFDVEGNPYLTEDVKKELKYAMSKDKRIYKLVLERNERNESDIKFINILPMDKQSLETRILSNLSNKNDWVLKSLRDYQLWLDNNNPEFIDFLNSQFKNYKLKDGKGAKHAVIPHHNSLYDTDEHNKVKWDTCRYHQYGHAFIDPIFQEKKLTCPFYLPKDTYSKPNYSQWKWDYLGEIPVNELFLRSRTIHKSMFIFKDETFRIRDGGIVRRIPGKRAIKGDHDYTKIVGAEPVIDIDIIPECKDKGYSFFHKKIFNQYTKVKKLSHKFMEERLPGIDYKFGFSGNGLYLYIEPLIFEDIDWDFGDFFWNWRDAPDKENKKNTILYLVNKMLTDNKLDALRIESTYAWRSYFKAMGTFHLSKERISIPLNKDEVIDYDWLNEMTNIKLGLEGNVMKEIIKKADWKW